MKKILALVLALAMALGTFSIAAAAPGDETEYIPIKVEGKITRLRDDSVTIDGKNYVVADGAAIVSLNEGKDFEKLNNVTGYDVMNEEVVLYLDLKGEIAVMAASAKATGDDMYGIVTWYYEGRNPSVSIFTSEGEEVEYYFEKRADAIGVFEGLDNEYPNDNVTVWAIKYELNSDGEIAKNSVEAIIPRDGGWAAYSARGEVHGTVDVVAKAADRRYLEVTAGFNEGDIYHIGADTVIMKALEGTFDEEEGYVDVELDPEVTGYDTLVDMSFDSEAGYAIIFGEADKTAEMIVFLDPGFTGSRDDVYFGIVTDAPWKVGDDWFAETDVFGEGIGDYKVDEGDVGEGDLVAFCLDNSDKVKIVARLENDILNEGYLDEDFTEKVALAAGNVYEREGSFIALNNIYYLDDMVEEEETEIFKVADGAVLYQIKLNDEFDPTGYDLDGTTRLTRINEGFRIVFLMDMEEKEITAGLVLDNPERR
jgi:hypothetical protein